jgi:hypothetical protein
LRCENGCGRLAPLDGPRATNNQVAVEIEP